MRTRRTVELTIEDGTRLVVHEERELTVARGEGSWRVFASLEPSRIVIVRGGAARAFTLSGEAGEPAREMPEEG